MRTFSALFSTSKLKFSTNSIKSFNKNTVISTPSSKTHINFIEWLIGLVEGDGTFTIVASSRPSGTYHYCAFILSQSAYNIKLLNYIKDMLQCGYICAKDPNNHYYDYRIVSQDDLRNIVVPLFNTYSMHSIKYWRYSLFLEALSIKDPYSPRFAELKQRISNILLSYKSPFLHKVPSKSWIVGFIEAEGSFHIIETRNRGTLEHGFNVAQKYDIQILEYIRNALSISANVHNPKTNKKGSKSILSTRRIDNIKFIIEYFNNTMVGVKYL